MYSGRDGHAFKTCKKYRDGKASKKQGDSLKRTSFDLDECYETHEGIVEAVSSFMERHDNHVFDASGQSLRIKATFTSTFLIDNDISVEACTQTADHDLQKRAAILLRNNLFDCTGYFFHVRRVNVKSDGSTFTLSCSRSSEAKIERHPSNIQRYIDVFDCQGELHITLSKVYKSAMIVYDHKCHMETHKFHMTEEVRNYIRSQKRLTPRQIYQNLIQMANEAEFEKTDLCTITRQQVYNFWLSITKSEWERDGANDFRSAQLLVAEHDGFELIEGLQEPGVSLAFMTRCFINQDKYDRAKMTEVFLYCVLTEYDLVSLPLSYLLLDTRGLSEEGKRGLRLTQWFTALRNAGLKPNTVHTDKDFAEVTAARIAFRPGNSRYNHHLCLWHSLRAIDQYVTGKVRSRDQARVIRTTIKRHLLRHSRYRGLSATRAARRRVLVYESYEEIHASSDQMLDYCKSIDQPRLFRYFWSNWYRPSCGNVGSRWEIASLSGRSVSSGTIPISRTTMRLESHWRILKKDYASHLIRPRLDVLAYIICTGLFLHLYLQVEAARVKSSLYEDFVSLWRQCANVIDGSVMHDRDNIYHTDKSQWVCSCPSFIFNSRYMCKHLVSYYSFPRADGSGKYVVTQPPRCTTDLFQQRLPLIRFDDLDVGGPGNGNPTEGSSNCVDSMPVVQSSDYLGELKSLQLLPSEDPEAKEENDERLLQLLQVMQWAAGESHSNPRMQQDLCSFIRNQDEFIARYKRSYEAAMGRARSADGQTMTKAQKSYYYMRPQNHGQRSVSSPSSK
ncbi:hypothetical protein V1507DRAFT_499494 [Lipomyces tetrasporus]